MSTKKFYHCNLCGDEIQHCGFEKDMKHGVAVYFINDTNAEFKGLSETNNHLCAECVRAIVKAAREWVKVDK